MATCRPVVIFFVQRSAMVTGQRRDSGECWRDLRWFSEALRSGEWPSVRLVRVLFTCRSCGFAGFALSQAGWCAKDRERPGTSKWNWSVASCDEDCQGRLGVGQQWAQYRSEFGNRHAAMCNEWSNKVEHMRCTCCHSIGNGFESKWFGLSSKQKLVYTTY